MSNSKAYINFAEEMLKQLPRGAFLTVKDGEVINTMTIGWGSIGYIWRRPILMVLVRYSRYTYDLIENSPDFTVSFPYPNDMKKMLAEAGSKSGRDMNKFEEFSIDIQTSKKVKSPAIAGCNLVFECKTVFKQTMDPDNLDLEIKNRFYSDEDYHVMYYGEILDCYLNE